MAAHFRWAEPLIHLWRRKIQERDRYAALSKFRLSGQSFSTLEAAQDVLGAILADGDAFPPFGWLKPHHSTEPVHQRILTAAVALNARGERIFLGGIRRALRGDESLVDLDRVSPRNDYLASLWGASCPLGYAEQMAAVLADDWTRREAARIAHKATHMAIGDNARRTRSSPIRRKSVTPEAEEAETDGRT